MAGTAVLSSDFISRVHFVPEDGKATPSFRSGQFTTIWVNVGNTTGPFDVYQKQRDGVDATNNSLSISIKKHGLVSGILHDAEIGTTFDLSAPYGCFDLSGVEQLWLSEIDAPVIFISAGIGITPVLAMLENIYVTRPASGCTPRRMGKCTPTGIV